MDAAEFLFPHDLSVTETKISKVLVIGSCMAEAYIKNFKTFAPDITFDHVMFNNVAEIPDLDANEARSYDLQYIQLSLRHVVLDQVIDFSGFITAGMADAILTRGKQLMRLMLDAVLKHNKTHNLLTLVANFLVPQVPVAVAADQVGSATDFTVVIRQLNDELARLVSFSKNVYIADVNAIGDSMGKRYFLEDVTGFYSHAAYWGPASHDFDVSPAWNAPSNSRLDPLPRMDEVYESQVDQFFRAVWRQIECHVRIARQTDMVKLVIFDLDDTMYRGQIAEDYRDDGGWPAFHGWPLGIWEAVQHLRARGIIVAICSKNNEDLVRERWSRAIPMWLTLDDFPLREINWNPKAENIAKIVKAASVTAKSTVFVDDNPVERESVKAALPGLRVIGSNPHVTRRILLWSPETQIATRSQESANREDSIRQLQVRENDRTQMSREDFLKGLNARVEIKSVPSSDHPDYARAVELLNKTNQFNTTGIRWNNAQIETLFEMGGSLICFNVTDKYTDYGLVGVILFRAGLFAQFAMSCRVLGLEIETSVINAIMAHFRDTAGTSAFMARIFETEANMVCRDVFVRCGFVGVTEDPALQFRPDLEIALPAPHLTINMSGMTIVEHTLDTAA